MSSRRAVGEGWAGLWGLPYRGAGHSTSNKSASHWGFHPFFYVNDPHLSLVPGVSGPGEPFSCYLPFVFRLNSALTTIIIYSVPFSLVVNAEVLLAFQLLSFRPFLKNRGWNINSLICLWLAEKNLNVGEGFGVQISLWISLGDRKECVGVGKAALPVFLSLSSLNPLLKIFLSSKHTLFRVSQTWYPWR